MLIVLFRYHMPFSKFSEKIPSEVESYIKNEKQTSGNHKNLTSWQEKKTFFLQAGSTRANQASIRQIIIITI